MGMAVFPGSASAPRAKSSAPSELPVSLQLTGCIPHFLMRRVPSGLEVQFVKNKSSIKILILLHNLASLLVTMVQGNSGLYLYFFTEFLAHYSEDCCYPVG